jgi:hypothetical protein
MQLEVRIETGLDPGEVLERAKLGTAFKVALVERENETELTRISSIARLDAVKETSQLPKREWAARGLLWEYELRSVFIAD